MLPGPSGGGREQAGAIGVGGGGRDVAEVDDDGQVPLAVDEVGDKVEVRRPLPVELSVDGHHHCALVAADDDGDRIDLRVGVVTGSRLRSADSR